MSISTTPPRCDILPLPDQAFSLRIDGIEKLRWNGSPSASRPFFFPVLGPSGESLTRMGHPGAPDHDHHASVWFAHHSLMGISFWAITATSQIRQTSWLVQENGDDAATLAVRLGWFDGHDPAPLIEQDLIITLHPLTEGEYALDLQSTFRPLAAQIEFQQTNFGFFAVRVAKSISAHFGGGKLTNSHGATGEPAIFGKSALWMDYSGPIAVLKDSKREYATEGITYFDHPSNPNHPTKWHVRDDGWMGASACFDGPLVTTKDHPLKLRYLLHIHNGDVNPERAAAVMEQWKTWPALEAMRSTKPHRQFDLVTV